MILTTVALPLLFAAGTVIAQNHTRDGCPKTDYACIDVMNSSQCIAQLVIEKLTPVTKEALAKCVEYEGTVTKLPGASKLCRCPGCHTAPINAAIAEMFPPPCT